MLFFNLIKIVQQVLLTYSITISKRRKYTRFTRLNQNFSSQILRID